MKAIGCLALLLLIGAPQAEAAEPLVADLSSHLVAITTGFTGTEVVLFGATDGPGDIIAVVRGPGHDTAVRHKSRVAGIWMNTRQLIFRAVPSYYAVYSTRPLDEIMPPGMQALHEIGLDRLRLSAPSGTDAAVSAAFRAALIGERRRQRLFAETVGGFGFLGNRLFHLPLEFPANLPTGNYSVQIYLVRDRAVVSAETTPLYVSQAGIGAEVEDFAARRALAYGVLAAIGAALAGWLASLPFRHA